ncbi:MAG: potassium channel family protein [Actinomycetota bacterium]
MNIVIAGAGNVGRFMAKDLIRLGHRVTLIDHDGELIARHKDKILCEWVQADAAEPLNLLGAGLKNCDVMVAATGDDKVNLVASLLAKQEFGIRRVVARVNHPNNEWLFNESWGVDSAVSPPHMLTSQVEEEVVVGDLVTLKSLERGKVVLVEVKLAENSPVAGKVVAEVNMPRDCALVAVVRAGHVIAPREETPLMVGDEVVALAAKSTTAELEWILTGSSTPAPEDG